MACDHACHARIGLSNEGREFDAGLFEAVLGGGHKNLFLYRQYSLYLSVLYTHCSRHILHFVALMVDRFSYKKPLQPLKCMRKQLSKK